MVAVIDAWMHHPAIAETIAVMEAAGVERGLLSAWHGPQGPLIGNDDPHRSADNGCRRPRVPRGIVEPGKRARRRDEAPARASGALVEVSAASVKRPSRRRHPGDYHLATRLERQASW